MVDRIICAAGGRSDPWDRLVVGCRAYLAAALDPAVQQVGGAAVVPLLHLLFGALSEGALLVARADEREAALAEVGDTVVRLLEGLEVK